MAFAGKTMLPILDRIGNDNDKHEFYLTDAIAIARAMNLRSVALEVTEDEVGGINTKAQLAQAEAVMQQRLRQAALDAGATLVAPDTVHLAADTKLGRDVVIEPYVVFGPGVVVEEDADRPRQQRLPMPEILQPMTLRQPSVLVEEVADSRPRRMAERSLLWSMPFARAISNRSRRCYLQAPM